MHRPLPYHKPEGCTSSFKFAALAAAACWLLLAPACTNAALAYPDNHAFESSFKASGGIHAASSAFETLSLGSQQEALDASLAAARRRVMQSVSGTTPNSPCPVAPRTLPLPDPLPPNLESAFEFIKNKFGEVANTTGVTGMSVSVVYDQDIIASWNFGSESKGGKPVTGDSLFAIGSCSKIFTDFMLYHLKDSGKVNLDTLVSEINPNYHPKPYPADKSRRGATLSDLGSHTSGLPRYTPCAFGDCPLDLKEAVDIINNWTLIDAPGHAVSYSNTGFSVLGRTLELVTGSTFEDYLASNLLKPLGMTNTYFTPPTNSPNMTHAYGAGGVEYPPLDLGFAVPAGGIFSSTNDMAKLMSLFFRDMEAQGSHENQVLDGKTIREWLSHRVETDPNSVPENSVYYLQFGIPWEILMASVTAPIVGNYSRYYIISKDGAVPGWHSLLLMDPNLKVGMFATMSEGGDGVGDFYTETILQMAFNVIPVMYSVLADIDAHHPVPAPPSINDYVGTYSGSTFGIEASAVIEAVDAKLFVTAATEGWQSIPLRWLGGDLFVQDPVGFSCSVLEGGNSDYVFQFNRDSNNAVASLLVQGLVTVAFPKVA